MRQTRITCGACGSSWVYPGVEQAFVQSDLAARPCPICEAYTLSISTETTSPRLPTGTPHLRRQADRPRRRRARLA